MACVACTEHVRGLLSRLACFYSGLSVLAAACCLVPCQCLVAGDAWAVRTLAGCCVTFAACDVGSVCAGYSSFLTATRRFPAAVMWPVVSHAGVPFRAPLSADSSMRIVWVLRQEIKGTVCRQLPYRRQQTCVVARVAAPPAQLSAVSVIPSG